MLDALVSHLYAIYLSEKEGVKPTPSGTVTPTKSSSSPCEFVPSSPDASIVSTASDTSGVAGTEEAKTIPVTTNEELVKELMTKALNALETIKECVL